MRTRALRLSCACLRVCRVRLRSVGSPLVCVRRYIALGSSLLSVCGACAIIFSALRFKELSKRFFAIRLIFFLALTDCMAAVLHILGATLDIQLLLHQIPRPPVICNVQAAGLLYFNLASMLWTSCFAFTLYRDVVPSHRRHALRKYELYFHALCWPLPAVLTGVCTSRACKRGGGLERCMHASMHAQHHRVSGVRLSCNLRALAHHKTASIFRPCVVRMHSCRAHEVCHGFGACSHHAERARYR